MNEALRAQILEEALRLLREAFSSGEAHVKGWPTLGSLQIERVPEDAVKLFMAISAE